MRRTLLTVIIFFAVSMSAIVCAQCPLAFQIDSLDIIGMKELRYQYFTDTGELAFSDNEGYDSLEQGPMLRIYGRITNNSDTDVSIVSAIVNNSEITEIEYYYQWKIIIENWIGKYEIITDLQGDFLWTSYFEYNEKDHKEYIKSASTIPYCLEITPYARYFAFGLSNDDMMEKIELGIKFQEYLSYFIRNARSVSVTLQNKTID